MLQPSAPIVPQKISEEQPISDDNGVKSSGPAIKPAMPAEIEYESSTGDLW